MELFHTIADPDCAAVRRGIVEMGLKGRIDFRNIDISADARAQLEARLGKVEVPALWTGERVIAGATAILGYLKTLNT
jgi:glutathione S-transferase